MNKVGVGYNVALASLIDVPNCRNGEVQPSERRYGDGGVKDIAPFSAPTFDVFEYDEISLQEEYDKFGLLEADTSEVTWYTRDDLFNWHRYNGIAVRPEPGVDGSWTQYFLRGFTIYIHSLVELVD